MDVLELLIDLYDRVPPLVDRAVDGLDADQMAEPPGPAANTIGWLVWHIGRGQDAQIASLTGEPQQWVSGSWPEKFGLGDGAADPSDTGYGHSREEMLSIRPAGPDVVRDYVAAVHGAAAAYLRTLSAADLDRVIDRNYDPPVTVGVRLGSIVDDCLQHAGQAAYARGVLGI